ncbi:MAG: hypothetical protein M3122_00495 [Actinomycetota bacterium]|nr:hypothetical protein [Actinomycetota bacterium]
MIPCKQSARFVWRMKEEEEEEEVLDLCKRPHDPLFPVVCFDERPYQLLAEVRQELLCQRDPGGPSAKTTSTSSVVGVWPRADGLRAFDRVAAGGRERAEA